MATIVVQHTPLHGQTMAVVGVFFSRMRGLYISTPGNLLSEQRSCVPGAACSALYGVQPVLSLRYEHALECGGPLVIRELGTLNLRVELESVHAVQPRQGPQQVSSSLFLL